MPVYSEKVMDHFMHPRNVGEIENPDGVGEVGNPVCGDMMTFYIKVKDNKLEDVKFKTFGCGAAIAVSSMVSEMAKGKPIEEAQKITPELVAQELEGLPKQKFHCSNLGAQALNKAIDDYLAKQGTQPKAESGHCPFCDVEGEDSDNPICAPCQINVKKE
ncbi:MAG: Fe-S cluster assembly scaffold protein NifU [Dehalococcoidales bacterium]|nr:Fe-S cluster assembly scaffold protein NifU [Dehalococcoidales bacterium]